MTYSVQSESQTVGLRTGNYADRSVTQAKLSLALQNLLVDLVTSSNNSLTSGDIQVHVDAIAALTTRMDAVEATNALQDATDGMTADDITAITALITSLQSSDGSQDDSIASLLTTLGTLQTANSDMYTALTAAQQVNTEQAAAITALQTPDIASVYEYDASSGGNNAIYSFPSGGEVDLTKPYEVYVNGQRRFKTIHFTQDGLAILFDTTSQAFNAGDEVVVVGKPVATAV